MTDHQNYRPTINRGVVELFLNNAMENSRAVDGALELFTEDEEAGLARLELILKTVEETEMIPDTKSDCLATIAKGFAKAGHVKRAMEICLEHAWVIGSFFHGDVLVEVVIPMALAANDLNSAKTALERARSLTPDSDPENQGIWEPRFFGGGLYEPFTEHLAERGFQIERHALLLEARELLMRMQGDRNAVVAKAERLIGDAASIEVHENDFKWGQGLMSEVRGRLSQLTKPD